MSPFVLSVLKYSFLVLLYFFVYRAIRAVASDLYGGRRQAPPPREAKAARPSRGGKAPASAVLRSSDGRKLATYPLAEPFEIGRAESCAVRPDDAYVSQVHARLYGKDGTWYVEDMGSTNGTYLNEQRVTSPVRVHAGDRVRVGKTILELRR